MDNLDVEKEFKRPTNKKAFVEVLTEEITDHRKGNAVRHSLQEIIIIGILCIICNGDTFTDMELFGKIHEQKLRKYLQLPQGIPSHDTFGDVFSRLEPNQLGRCFNYFTQALKETVEGHCIALDGKSIRGSYDGLKSAKHVVTAFACDIQLVLGQLAVAERSNEITAIPQLLEMFCVKGNTITIDAIGTQTTIAQMIIDKGGDYVLALKENQPSLYANIKLYMESEILPCSKTALKDLGHYAKTLDKEHGRIESRECFLITNLDWLEDRNKWAGLSGAALIRSTRQLADGTSSHSHHYVIYSSQTMTAKQLLKIKRGHWAIENQLHWMLDMVFHEDDSRVRVNNAAEVLNIFRKLALQLIKLEPSVKSSTRAKRLRCAYDLDYAFKCIGVMSIS